MGMLFFDNSKTDLQEKLLRAAGRFKTEFGRECDSILVHQTTLAGVEPAQLSALPFQVRVYKPVIPGHFWVCGSELMKAINPIMEDE